MGTDLGGRIYQASILYLLNYDYDGISALEEPTMKCVCYVVTV